MVGRLGAMEMPMRACTYDPMGKGSCSAIRSLGGSRLPGEMREPDRMEGG